MKTGLFAFLLLAGLATADLSIAQNRKTTTTTTTTEQTATDQGQIGDQATMDTKSGKKARKAEKKLAKGKEHKALKKQVKADEKEATGR